MSASYQLLRADLPIANSYTVGQRLFQRTYIGSYEYHGVALTAVIIPNASKSDWQYYVYDHALLKAKKQNGFATAADAIQAAVTAIESFSRQDAVAA